MSNFLEEKESFFIKFQNNISSLELFLKEEKLNFDNLFSINFHIYDIYESLTFYYNKLEMRFPEKLTNKCSLYKIIFHYFLKITDSTRKPENIKTLFINKTLDSPIRSGINNIDILKYLKTVFVFVLEFEKLLILDIINEINAEIEEYNTCLKTENSHLEKYSKQLNQLQNKDIDLDPDLVKTLLKSIKVNIQATESRISKGTKDKDSLIKKKEQSLNHLELLKKILNDCKYLKESIYDYNINYYNIC